MVNPSLRRISVSSSELYKRQWGHDQETWSHVRRLSRWRGTNLQRRDVRTIRSYFVFTGTFERIELSELIESSCETR